MKRSRKAWNAAEDEAFLEIWQQEVNDLRGPRKNSHVHIEMAEAMKKEGYDVSPSSVKTKIDNLTAKYRKCKTEIGITGGSPSVWPLYNKVHQILDGFCINNVEELIEESFIEISSECSSGSIWQACSISPDPPLSPLPLPPDECSGPSSSTAPRRSIKKREIERLVTVCEKMEQNLDNAMNKFTDSTEELVQLEKAKLLAIQGMQADSKRLTDGVLDFMKHFK